MYPELITRPDLKVFLPPIGGLTCYIFGNHELLSDPKTRVTVRVHDECNGSDVFGSDICTCRPYLVYGMKECIKEAQNGGVGLIIYCKFLKMLFAWRFFGCIPCFSSLTALRKYKYPTLTSFVLLSFVCIVNRI